jgi:transposase-like protein
MRQLEIRHFSSKGGTKVSKDKPGKSKKGGTPQREYKRHPIGLRQHAVERMKLGENVSALARELGVDRTLLYIWRARTQPQPSIQAGMEAVSDVQQLRIQELETKIAGLEGALGRKGMELDFFAGALRRIAESRPKNEGSGVTASTRKSAEGPQRRKAGKANPAAK